MTNSYLLNDEVSIGNLRTTSKTGISVGGEGSLWGVYKTYCVDGTNNNNNNNIVCPYIHMYGHTFIFSYVFFLKNKGKGGLCP